MNASRLPSAVMAAGDVELVGTRIGSQIDAEAEERPGGRPHGAPKSYRQNNGHDARNRSGDPGQTPRTSDSATRFVEQQPRAADVAQPLPGVPRETQTE